MQIMTRPDLFYSINIVAENMFVVPRVNGAPLTVHGRFRPFSLTTDITRELMPGANVIQIDYEPFDTEKRSYTPHEGVRVQVMLTRSGNAIVSPDIKEEVTLFSGRYDPETMTLVASQDSVFGEGALTFEDGGLRASGGFTLAPVDIVYNDAVSRGASMRLTLPFDVSDIAMTTPPWANAEVLQDTPALREELWQAYRQVHAALASGNPDMLAQVAEPMFTHNARVIGYASAAEIAAELNARQPIAGSEGRRLAPMPPVLAATTSKLEFSADGRLVQFMSAPLGYENDAGDMAGRLYYWFCRIGDQPLQACFVQDFG